MYEYSQNVSLICLVGGAGSYNFTWKVPAGFSLERGTISNDGSSSMLTFEVREEDGGEFSCRIHGSTGPFIGALVTVGNTLLHIIIETMHKNCLHLSSSHIDGTNGCDSGVQR